MRRAEGGASLASPPHPPTHTTTGNARTARLLAGPSSSRLPTSPSSCRLDRRLAATAAAQTGEQQRIRSLFERATHLALPAKKMKFLFRRYLDYEKAHGSAATVEHVKRRAMEFVEGSLRA